MDSAGKVLECLARKRPKLCIVVAEFIGMTPFNGVVPVDSVSLSSYDLYINR